MTNAVLAKAEELAEGAGKAVLNWLGGVGAMVSADALILFNAAKTIWETLAPEEWAIFKPIVEEAITDLFDGDFADLETVVLQKAEAAGVDFLHKLDSAALQAILALFVAQKAKAA